MKNLKFLLVAGLMAVSAPAFAQFANTGNAGGSKRTGASSASTVTEKSYSRVELSYNPITLSPDKGDDSDLTGLSFGYVKGFNIAKSMPLYVEAGVRLTYAWDTEEDSYSDSWTEYINGQNVRINASATEKYKDSYLGITVPINLAYRFAVPNSDITITPFIGVTLRGNILGKTSYEYEVTASAPDYGIYESESSDEDWNMFDKDDVGKDDQWKRFQFGWNIGAGVNYKSYYLGFSYGSDFSELAKDLKTNNWAISLGYSF